MRSLPTPVLLTGLVLVTFGIYHEVWTHEFVWDTNNFVLKNPWLRHPGFDDFVAMFTKYHRANWQPMVWLSHALDFALFGDAPGWHHLSNVAYHALDCCLVYWFVVTLLRQTELPRAEAGSTALLSAAIFAVHPQHVQSVAWVVERKDTLSVCFTLLCFIAYIKVKQRDDGGSEALPLLLLVLALMSKAMAVTIPVILLLFDVYPLKRWPDRVPAVRLIAEKWSYFLVAFAVVGVTLYTQRIAMVSLEQEPLKTRPLTAANNYLLYVRNYLVPINLSPFYAPVPSMANILAPGYWAPGFAMILSVLGAGVVLWVRGWRWPLLMALFYFVTLAPVSGLIAVGPAKALDYYAYLATLPIGLALSLGIVRLLGVAGRLRSVVAGLVAFWLIALSLISFAYVKIWQTELTLWLAAYQYYPKSPYVLRNLSGSYLLYGQVDEALRYAKEGARYSQVGRDWLIQLESSLAQQADKEGDTPPPASEVSPL
ncbi:MAG: hypothetical protein KDI19_04665 [Pseudomonadales bacterium]|nr:hypothetical protein [Pseudomonadales bacterium]